MKEGAKLQKDSKPRAVHHLTKRLSNQITSTSHNKEESKQSSKRQNLGDGKWQSPAKSSLGDRMEISKH